MPDARGLGSSPVRVALDTMGGDHGPEETVKGAVQALQHDDVEVLLVGDPDQVQAQLDRYELGNGSISVAPSQGVIGDDEHPLQAIRHKPEASVMVATGLVKQGNADVMVSMGSTGASMASSVLALGLMEGLDRPCLGGPFLSLAPRTVLLDMGSSVDCRPAMLLNFAALGVAFARKFLDIQDPRVGLLSVGAETAKGNRQVQESHQLFNESGLNFVGNVEGMDFFTQRADVIVCDGFVGNILMKFTEGLGSALFPFLEQRLAPHLTPQAIKAVASDLWQVTNLPRTTGGPLLGVNGPVVLGHGSCKADGIAGAIHTGVRYVKLGLLDSMRQELLGVDKRVPGDSESHRKADG